MFAIHIRSRAAATTAALFAAPLLTLVFAAAGHAAPPAASNEAGAPDAPVASAPRFKLLDLRDAPIRQALDMVLLAGRKQFSLDNNVMGFVTLAATEQPVDADVNLICQASTIPLVVARENEIYFIRHKPQRPVDSVAADVKRLEALKPGSLPIRGRRRIAGVLLADAAPGSGYAILETGSGGPDTDVRVVHVGDSVPSAAPGETAPRVAVIDRSGILLETADGSRTRVRLRSRDKDTE